MHREVFYTKRLPPMKYIWIKTLDWCANFYNKEYAHGCPLSLGLWLKNIVAPKIINIYIDIPAQFNSIAMFCIESIHVYHKTSITIHIENKPVMNHLQKCTYHVSFGSIYMNRINVTIFLSIPCLSNSEHWSH